MITPKMHENPFLQGLTSEQSELLSPLFVPVALPAGAAVFHQGDAAAHMYVLVAGIVSILYKPYDGPQITLTALHVGDVFGWSSVVGNPVYASDAIAITATRALRARGADIRAVCIQHPTTGAQILEKLAVAVAPRWRDSRTQVDRLLKREMLNNSAQARTSAAH
jgi:CRP-like cAMP-binding protein